MPVRVSARDCLHSKIETTIIAITEKLIRAAVFQWDGESAKRLNAAPVFSVCVIRKNPGTTWMCVYIWMRAATSRLLQRSSSTRSTR